MIKDNHAFIFLLKCYMIIICWVVIHLLYCCVGCNMKKFQWFKCKTNFVYSVWYSFMYSPLPFGSYFNNTHVWLNRSMTSDSIDIIYQYIVMFKNQPQYKKIEIKQVSFHEVHAFLWIFLFFISNYPWNKFLCLILLLYITG